MTNNSAAPYPCIEKSLDRIVKSIDAMVNKSEDILHKFNATNDHLENINLKLQKIAENRGL